MKLEDKLLYFKIGLLSNIIKLDEFEKWLDKTFKDSDDDILLQLEECKDIDEIVTTINEYYFKIKYNQNPDKIIKEILLIVKEKYSNRKWNLEQTCDYLYVIYSLIDTKYINSEPYCTMCYINDGIGTWAFDEDITKRLEDVFKYCK